MSTNNCNMEQQPAVKSTKMKINVHQSKCQEKGIWMHVQING